ncbi:MAG: hypothetical protein KDC00_14715 [Flavobacteriales bacterium]|nr:hypothetical protein [Flavobacteriales bacterium]
MRPLLIALLLFAFLPSNAQPSCDSLETLLSTMLDKYEWLRLENEQIMAEMDTQRMQVDSLRSSLRRGNYDLEKARKEAEVLRGIMKGYVVTIDSLN